VTPPLGSLLVVDDEEMNRDMLSRRLELEGYSVSTAASGREALEMIATQPFGVVLLDVTMPDQNGFEVLQEIRKTQSSIDLPVIMVTARSQSEDVVTAFECGANDYITKPIHFPVALARITSHLTSKLASDALRKSELRYSLSARGANDGLWDWDLQTNTVYYSPRWKSMLGYGESEIGDSSEEWFRRIHADDLPQVRAALEAHRAGETDQFENEHRILHKDQTYRWVLSRGVSVRDDHGRELRMAGSLTDITRAKAADALTGLPNRVLFMDRLTAALEQAQKNPGDLFAVLFCDLDGFKVVNDSLGHLAGDQLLITTAERLESCLRRSDTAARISGQCTIARFGGDEFVILLGNLRRPEDACRVAERILATVSKPVTINGHAVVTSASIGIAVSSDHQHAEDLLRDADTAMYRAKSSGKSRFALFDQNMREEAVARLEIEADLRQALDRNEFCLHYQPIVSLSTGRIKGFEALVRWMHPKLGLTCPDQFVPIAEETGQIVQIGLWVLREACTKLRSWQTQFSQDPPLFMSVNLSCKQFADQGLIEDITTAVRETGIDPKFLKLEITESTIMDNPAIAARTLTSLRELGVRVGIDDFGTGYSSLNHLQQFPIDTLKVDRSFISRLDSSDQANEIVQMIVSLAHNLQMDVVAEGIENDGQHTWLQSLACEYGQGYLFSQPVSDQTIDALLAKQNATADSLAK
jgi:diguanylate cyclase (GGDEF)-like protein/PAS domain S-box-containing protein